jgi:hypothetical protein
MDSVGHSCVTTTKKSSDSDDCLRISESLTAIFASRPVVGCVSIEPNRMARFGVRVECYRWRSGRKPLVIKDIAMAIDRIRSGAPRRYDGP